MADYSCICLYYILHLNCLFYLHSCQLLTSKAKDGFKGFGMGFKGSDSTVFGTTTTTSPALFDVWGRPFLEPHRLWISYHWLWEADWQGS